MEEGEKEPIILSQPAARRLRLLRNHGVDLSPRLVGAFQEAWASPDRPGPAAEPPPIQELRLAADLLPRPLQLGPGFNSGAPRDVQTELAVPLGALERLQLAAGSCVEVRSAAQPDSQPHVARMLALAPDADEGTALLAPSLAHNLGLRLHLRRLLASEDNDDARSSGTSSSSRAAPPGQEAVLVRQLSSAPAVPGAEAGSRSAGPPVRVATAVHIQVVRQPEQRPLLQAKHAAKPPGGGGQHGEPLAALAAAAADADSTDAIVSALRRQLADTCQLVCEGDVLAARKRAPDPATELLASLLPADGKLDADHAVAPAAGPLFYFKIARLLPSGQGPMAIDASNTTVQLVGTCSGSLPAGLASYLDASPAPLADAGHDQSVAPSVRHVAGGFLLPLWRSLAEVVAVAMHPSTAGVEFRLALLLHGPPGSGRRTAVAAAAEALGCHVATFTCHDIAQVGAPEKNTLESLKVAFEAAAEYRPAVLVLTDLDALWRGGSPGYLAKVGSALAEGIASGLRSTGGSGHGPVVLVAVVDAVDDVPAPLHACFTHELHAAAPDYAARRELLRSMLGGAAASLSAHVLDDCALHTAGLLPRELRAVAADACAAAVVEPLSLPAILSGSVNSQNGAAVANGAGGPSSGSGVSERHLQSALGQVRARMATDIGAPRIPSVRWEDVGGLADVKRAILDTVQLPLQHPELFATGLRRRSGLLLYGPPGTGKTLLAKAVATECSIAFLSVKGPELINMYVGESERQIREVFARARRARPCVVFFDELDSLAPARGKGSDSGGVMDRVVSQLLAEIDSIQGGSAASDLFIIGATNRPDLLDPALLRPGRLDKLLYVGIAGDVPSRLSVLRALTRKFRLAADVDMGAIAEVCPARFTGADMYALCSDAWMAALKRQVGGALDDAADGRDAEPAGAASEADGAGGKREEGFAAEVEVGQADFLLAVSRLTPSLAEEEVARYEELRLQYEQRRP